MDFNQIKELITLIDTSTINVFELTHGNTNIKMNKNYENISTTTATVAVTATERITPQEGEIIASPIVGTYYAASSPDKPPFVKTGENVKKGDVLCIIEAMKVMNEITAKQNGTIAEIFANNEQMVEFGQPLFRIIQE